MESTNKPEKLPEGYFKFSELYPCISKVLISQIGRDKNLMSVEPEGQTWGELLDGMTAYFTERLIFKDETFFKLTNNQINSDFEKIALWRNGFVGRFSDDGALDPTEGLPEVHIDDFLYKTKLWEAPRHLKNVNNISEMWSYCRNNLSSSSFVDPVTWEIRNSPNLDLSSFENYRDFFPIDVERWEYEDILRTWGHIKPYSGAIFVYKGNSPHEVAQKAHDLFGVYLSNGTFPRSNTKSYRHTLELCRRRYIDLPRSDAFPYLRLLGTSKEAFSKDVFEEWVTGEPRITSPTTRDRYWNDFLSMLPQKEAENLRKPGRKKSRKSK